MMRQTLKRVAVLGVIVVLSAAMTSCGKEPPSAPASAALTGARLPGDFSGAGPGALTSASTLPLIDRRILALTSQAARITYQSTSGIDGSEQLVSGTVFVPKTPPPADGWPIIAFGHGSTGVQHECAPSLSPTLLGNTDFVSAFIRAGFVVTMPDYQGLGLDNTYHPYLDAATVGNNMIDAVRAARKFVPTASPRWLAFGVSQGGQAAWAANELAGTYGQGLDLVATASLAPASDLVGLADAAAAGTLTAEQGPALQWILVALSRAHPDFNLDDYRHGIVKEKWEELSACEGDLAKDRSEIVKEITPNDLRPSTPEAVEVLRGYLQQMALPQRRSSAPMLISYGSIDQFILAEWTQRAVSAACDLGDFLESYEQVDKGHGDIDGAAAFQWLRDRNAGIPSVNQCVPAPVSNETPES